MKPETHLIYMSKTIRNRMSELKVILQIMEKVEVKIYEVR